MSKPAVIASKRSHCSGLNGPWPVEDPRLCEGHVGYPEELPRMGANGRVPVSGW